ncbi:hypothetical protein AB2B41_04780 [Marimonas sp. MJW-29]|uniref:Transposase n=1 Tax=Sulfitobacter sediminis TaxID=3234186 RepID=A0ABV3RK38_9RHOB
MSIRTDRLTDPQAAGPVRSRSFIPKGNGKTRHEGIGGLIKLVLGALAARLTGRWRKTPLFNPETAEPIAPVTLVPREEKQQLLAANA